MEKGKLLAFTIANVALEYLSEDEEEEKEILSLLAQDLATETERVNTKEPRSQHYVDNIVPRYSDQEFKTYFRMTRETFQALYDAIGFTFKKTMGRPTICSKKMILCAIWMLSTRDTIKSIGERFDLSKSSVVDIAKKICMTIIEHCSDVIKVPSFEEMRQIEEGFRMVTGFSGVIGAINGTQITMKTPPIAQEIYINQKRSHSVQLQAICDHRMIFWDCFCGYPGSVHDTEVFLNSEVYGFLNSGQVPPEYHILGDGGYPLTEYLMVPFYDDGNLNELQLNYNDKLKQTHCVINKALAYLKNRFQRLKYIEVDRTDKVPMYALASCILHNFCLKRHDYFSCTIETDEDFQNPDLVEDLSNEVAVSKRENLCQLLNQ